MFIFWMAKKIPAHLKNNDHLIAIQTCYGVHSFSISACEMCRTIVPLQIYPLPVFPLRARLREVYCFLLEKAKFLLVELVLFLSIRISGEKKPKRLFVLRI